MKASATVISSISNYNSINAEFTTVGATADQAKGSCWNTGPNYNVWFRFQATTNFLVAQVKSGGVYGTLQYPYLALWDSAGNQLGCATYATATGTLELSSITMTPGASYYLSVDNYGSTGYRGTFSLSIDDQAGYDFYEGALLIPSLSNWSSSNAAYTTLSATADRSKGSCWNTGPNYNRWFKFVATTNAIDLQVKSGGSYGSLQYPYIALWDSALNSLGCMQYTTATGTLELSSVGLTPGGTYYFSVDNYGATGYRGTFSLYVNDQPTYDFKEGAIQIPSLSNWSSANAAYSTIDATADRSKGSCANTGPNYNRWFSFTATTSFIDVQVKSGGAYGSLQYPYVAIWDSALNEIGCMQYSTSTGTLELSAKNLTPGGNYFLSVDNYGNTGYRGTFTLSVDDQPTYDFMEGAQTIPSTSNWSSTNAQFSTLNATADRSKGSCCNTGPNYNRWFKFTASTPFATVQVKSGGAYGTMQYPYIALWDSALNEVGCIQYATSTGTLELSVSNLTPGGEYYFSVDNYGSTGYRGSFSLYVDDQPTYNFMEGALAIPSTSNWSSANAAYTTINATADRSKGSCCNNGPNYNRWFYFTASTQFATIQVLSGGAYGTLQYPYIALWDSALNQVGCIQYSTATGTLELSVSGLSVGGRYYISVDNYGNTGYRGTFSLNVDDQPTYNFMEGAIAIPSTSNWSSANAAYTTVNATADHSKGNCWNTGPNYNRWFSFTASTQFATIQVLSGGAYGTLQYPYIAVWDSALNQVGCIQYSTSTGTLELSVNGLNVGGRYYFTVDNYNNNGYRGTFSLYVDDQPNYNFMEGALLIPSLSNWSSANAAYSTINATADRSKGSCWNTGPSYNRWFKFNATTSTITLQVKSGGAYGTMQYPYIALWDSALNQIGCAMYTTSTGTLELSQIGLTPGATYYVSVDNHSTAGYRGTFSLYANDQPTYDFQAGAVQLSSISNWCSSNAGYTTSNATADGTRPSCFSNGPNNNVWFKFNATTAAVTVLVKTGGVYGTMQYPYVTIWDTLNNVVSCMRYATATGTVELSYYGLTTGRNYYISVDNSTGYKGSFTVCVDDQPTYNYKEGAVELTQFNNWTSPQAAYSTVYANGDRTKGTCWTNGPNNNRWFKFLATTPNMQIDVISGGAFGTLQYPFMTLYNNLIVQMGCAKYVSATGTLGVTVSGLVPGNYYYIAVDNYIGYAGSFTLHINGFNPLPVKMVKYYAEEKERTVKLIWVTESEINNDHFEIQRSQDGMSFENIGIVKGNGNSTREIDYSFKDENPFTGLSFYKIVQVDYNGTSEEYGPISAHVDETIKEFKIESVSPNPFDDNLTVSLAVPTAGNASIDIYSQSGLKVHSENVELVQGENTFQVGGLDVLPTGVYMVTVIGEGIRCEPVRILKN
ncbi:MAG: T9SS type A sorting domain-containing protein [Bacteroidetes bacterium]|nr:T9SS type A sorting domain-containing protein [Bacteroidota bacterium]